MLAGFFAVAACAPRPPELVVPVGTVWNPAGWIVTDLGVDQGSRAGIVVLDLRRQRGADVPGYQLDFLGNGQLPLSLPIAPRTAPTGCDLTDRALTGLLAGTAREAVTLDFGRDSLWPLERQAVGTLGLPSIARQMVVVEMARRRVAFLPTGETAADRWSVDWTSVSVEDDRLEAWIQAGRGDSVKALLDFGALPVSALATPLRFATLTARQPSDEQNRRLHFPVCGDTITVVVAPSAVPLVIGAQRLGRTEIGVVVSAPAWVDAAAWPSGAELILGSDVLAKRGPVVIDVQQKRIGWVR